MKKTAVVATLLALLSLMACNKLSVKGKNGVTYKSALQYSNYISDKQRDIINLALEYGHTDRSNLEKLDSLINKIVATSSRYVTDIEGMPAWKGDSSFRDNAVALFKFYQKTFNEDCRYMIDVQKDGEITSEESVRCQQLAASITTTEGRLDARVKRVQQQFAAKNGFRIERSEQQDRINELKTGR